MQIGRGVDVQFGWEPRANRFHSQYLNLKPYFIDVAPVTQGEFSEYLQKTGAKALPAGQHGTAYHIDGGEGEL